MASRRRDTSVTPSNSSSEVPSENPLNYDDCIADDHTSSGPLVARCYAAVDRTGHCVWWLENDKPCLIIKSLEGNPSQAWPESSPFQQIVCENVGAGGKAVLLGVGMAGKAHWSATIEGDSMTQAIAMDIACRTAAVPEHLGSAYWISAPWIATSISENSLSLVHPDGITLIVDSIGNTSITVENRKMLVRPSIDTAHHQRGQTYRWRYVLRLGGRQK